MKNNKLLIGVLLLLPIVFIISSGGGGMLFTLLIVAGLFYYAYRTSKRIYRRSDEENVDYDYMSIMPVKQPKVSTTTVNETRRSSTLSQTEEDIWNMLTNDMHDMPKADDINYEDFDPPIPLEWSTLNPFYKKKKD